MHPFPDVLPSWYRPREPASYYPTGHSGSSGSISAILQVREAAMMHIMDKLTDKVDWHKKVFDDEIVARWRVEALAHPNEAFWKLAEITPSSSPRLPTTPIMTEKAFDYCIQELRCKARYFADTGIVSTLDATSAIAKSDCLIQPALADELRSAFDRLKRDQADSPDWHPETDEKVLDLVHPSMYPFVFASTKLILEDAVGVADAVEKWAGKGEVFDHIRLQNQDQSVASDVARRLGDYQWLPSDVALHDDGSVKFTSYINNLHPVKYPEIYGTIEKVVEKALPMWDQFLRVVVPADDVRAIRERRVPLPHNTNDENGDNWIPSSWEDLKAAKRDRSNSKKGDESEEVGDTDEGQGEAGSENIGSQDSDDESDDERLEMEWMDERQPVFLEPGPFEEVDYSPPYRLSQTFKDTGLQIIVKMASIELTPEKPSFPAGSWHIEGEESEHICATALYYLDSENITTSALSFRMLTDPDLSERAEYEVGQDQYHWLEMAHGIRLNGVSACLQNYGSVETREGRLLTFPNVFQHRVSSFQLVDPTKPGHRRFLALWLVDPYRRIISTANVPPQQQDWWVESVLGQSAEARQAALAKMPAELVQLLGEKGLIGETQPPSRSGKLPAELLNMVRTYWRDSPAMVHDRAISYRSELMDHRTAANEMAVEEAEELVYNFCEH